MTGGGGGGRRVPRPRQRGGGRTAQPPRFVLDGPHGGTPSSARSGVDWHPPEATARWVDTAAGTAAGCPAPAGMRRRGRDLARTPASSAVVSAGSGAACHHPRATLPAASAAAAAVTPADAAAWAPGPLPAIAAMSTGARRCGTAPTRRVEGRQPPSSVVPGCRLGWWTAQPDCPLASGCATRCRHRRTHQNAALSLQPWLLAAARIG